MKTLLPLLLLSLLSFVSVAQSDSTHFRKNVQRPAIVDTCVQKSEIKAAKLYTQWVEDQLSKAQTDNALLRFQVEQRGQRNEVLHTENDALKIAAVDFGKFQKTTGWVCAALGAVGAVLVGMAIGH